MAKCILIFNKQLIKEYPCQKDSITIGRNKDNTIVIENLAVSGYHARIDKIGSDFILTDLQSTNGTFINRKKIVSHKLSHGDNIVIGKHIILFTSGGKGKAEAEQKKNDMEQTMILDAAQQSELLSQRKAGTGTAKAPEKIGVLSFIDGSDLGEIELTKKLSKIGKADTSEIKISGMFMPATAATINKLPYGYAISSTGGKIKVNGEVIKDSIPLKDFDTIGVGSFKFQFYLKDDKGS